MEYRYLGNSGLRVSQFALGSWLTLGESIAAREAKAIIDVALDHGINHFDCADAYGNGEAERQLGELLSDRERSALVITSKLFWPMSNDPNDRGLSRKHILASIDRSLANLRTDHLDIYYCHREDVHTPVEETVLAMHDLVTQGKIRYWGTSLWSLPRLKKALRFATRHGLHRPIVEQLPYNLLERWVEKKLPVYRRLGIGMTVWSPLAGGLLTGKYQHGKPTGSRGDTSDWLNEMMTPANLAKVEKLISIAAGVGCSPAQLALAWLARQPVASILLGASSASQLADNLKTRQIKLDADLHNTIARLFRR